MDKRTDLSALKSGLLRGDIERIAGKAKVSTRLVHMVFKGQRKNSAVLAVILETVEANRVVIEAEEALTNQAMQLSMAFANA